ncbi:MAG: LPD38 domain-containing protein, partial [Acidobacteriota bacterium]
GIKKYAEYLYTYFIEEFYPVLKAGKIVSPEFFERLRVQIARIRRYADFTRFVLYGEDVRPAIEALGKDCPEYLSIEQSFSDAMKPFDGAPVELYRDYENYRIAMRELSFWSFRREEIKSGKLKGINPELQQKKLDQLHEKYGDAGMDFFKQMSEAHRKWEHDAILLPLLRSGWMSQRTYGTIVSKPYAEYYASFSREMEELDRQVLGGGKDPIKRLYGSERKKIPSTEGTIANFYKAVKLIETNRLYKIIMEGSEQSAEFANLFPEEKPKYMKVERKITAEVDPKLRSQITAVANKLGATVQTLKSIGGRRLGLFVSYMKDLGQTIPDEIRIRFAASEQTLAHELGHLIDEKFDLVGKMMGKDTAQVKRELRAIADDRLGEEFTDGFRKYVRKRKEQVAEFVARYITDKERIWMDAPEAASLFENIIAKHDELSPLLTMRETGQAALDKMMDKFWVRLPDPPKDTFTVGIHGIKKYIKPPPDILKALSFYTPSETHLAVKLLNLPTRLLRAGATLSFEFMARNISRDPFSAYIYSNYKYNPFTGLYNVLSDHFGAKKFEKEFEAAGGLGEFFAAMDRESTHVKASKMLKLQKSPKDYIYAANPVEALRYLSGLSEKLTRKGPFISAEKAGATPQEAMLESAEGSINFKRTGQERVLNQIIAFWRANLQGTDKLVRALSDRKTAPGVIWRAFKGITIPTLVLWAVNHDEDWYKELPGWRRYLFWNFKLTDDSPIISVPGPFDLMVIFGSFPLWLLNRFYDSDVEATKEFVSQAGKAFLPNIIPTAPLPPLEYVTNHSFFKGRSIEPKTVEKREPGLRYTKYTTDIAKAIGREANISPIMLENYVRGWTGTLGTSILHLVNEAFRPADI